MSRGFLPVLALGLALAAGFSVCGEPEYLVIRDVALIDGTGRPPVPKVHVIVRGSVIETVCSGDGVVLPAGAQTVDGRGRTLLPGLIDLHVHITVGAPGGGRDAREFSEAAQLRYLAAYLRAGITSVRSLGDDLEQIVALRRREAEGSLLGPRIFCCGPLFTAPGGHPTSGTTTVLLSAEQYRKLARRPNTPDEARQFVQELVREYKVDCVKCVLSGWGRYPRLDLGILAAIIEEAHGLGIPVAVHTDSLEDAKDAVRAGADTLEHGVDIPGQRVDDELLVLLRRHGTKYDATAAAMEALCGRFLLSPEALDDPYLRVLVHEPTLGMVGKECRAFERAGLDADRFRARQTTSLENLKRVYQAGVPLGMASDAGVRHTFHGESLIREIELHVEAGVKPLDAIHAATGGAAQTLGAAMVLGTIEPGRFADLLLVDGDPIEDASVLRRPVLVVKGGIPLDFGVLERAIQGDE